GDHDAEANASIGGFQDGVGAEWGGDEVGGGIGARFHHRLPHGVEDRHAVIEFRPAAAGGDAGDDLRAVLQHLPDMEGGGLAGDVLYHDPRAAIYVDSHTYSLRAASTARTAASVIVSAGVIFRPLSDRICLPRSTFVPWRRTTSGT